MRLPLLLRRPVSHFTAAQTGHHIIISLFVSILVMLHLCSSLESWHSQSQLFQPMKVVMGPGTALHCIRTMQEYVTIFL